MVIKARENLLGAWAFLIGVILAIAAGLFAGTIASPVINPIILGILAFLGIIVGLFVAEKDVNTFLLASVSLVIVSYMGISGLVLGAAIGGFYIGKIVASVLQTLLALFVPATIMVALKTVFSISKS
ncbi:MAG: hypothetical protein HYT35_00615 [Candidatus Staskawiczbacteria bacterium]|nr:hypothetical protein [Candidatus Staskawiczbacteria bacterium]